MDEVTKKKSCLIEHPPICNRHQIEQIMLYCRDALELIDDIADIHEIDEIEGSYLEDLSGESVRYVESDGGAELDDFIS